MKKIHFILISLFIAFVVFNCSNSSSNKKNVNDNKEAITKLNFKERDSLIKALHNFNDKKVSESKSLMFSDSATGNNPCYWIDFSINNYYLKEFIQYTKQPSCKDVLNYTIFASRECNIEVLEYLLKKGVNPNEIKDGRIALNSVLMLEIPSLDLNPAHAKEYIDIKSKLKSNKFKKETIKLLLKYGAKPNVKDEFGRTAIDYAKQLNDTEILNLLTKSK